MMMAAQRLGRLSGGQTERRQTTYLCQRLLAYHAAPLRASAPAATAPVVATAAMIT